LLHPTTVLLKEQTASMDSVSRPPSNRSAERILILILTYNGSRYIEDCLSSLQQLTYPPDAFEILVVDNASTDDTVAAVRREWPGVRVVENERNLGFAGGNNVGLRYAIGQGFDYVYLLNQDTVVTPDFLTETLAVVRQDSTIGAAQSKLLLYDEKDKINTVGNELHYLGFGYAGGHRTPDHEMDVAEIAYASGACVLLRVSALKDVGLFYENLFLYHEDLDLGWQLRLAGYKIMLSPRSVVYHKYEFSRSSSKFYYLERNRHLLILQNYKLATLLLIAPAAVAMQFAMFIYSFFAGFWREELRACAYFCRPGNWKKIFARRKWVQMHRRVADRDVVRVFIGKVEFEDLRNPLLKYVANPLFNAYWQIVRRLIWW
jgi:GT2 family glycosyltransferase